MIPRDAEKQLAILAKTFKAIAVTGARQVGKTTLVKSVFPDKPYVSLENPDTRNFALEDPRGFLNRYKEGVILDEVQRVPHLFSYLQEILDSSKDKGKFILTGSNNFLLQESISQSLAGRVGYLTLAPFSIGELQRVSLLPEDDDALLFKGMFPPIYDQDIQSALWCRNYIHTYVERDVRQMLAIGNLYLFERFLKILAGRNAQELNMSAIAVEAGVDGKTVQSWMSVLAAAHLVYLVKPYYRNFNKTIIKRPKVYFCDSSLVCSLLGITDASQVQTHPLRGSLFESMVMIELLKNNLNHGRGQEWYYWRTKAGHEIDAVRDSGNQTTAIEIKSSQTIHREYLSGLERWAELSSLNHNFLLYAGSEKQIRSNGIEVMNWREFIFQDK